MYEKVQCMDKLLNDITQDCSVAFYAHFPIGGSKSTHTQEINYMSSYMSHFDNEPKTVKMAKIGALL